MLILRTSPFDVTTLVDMNEALDVENTQQTMPVTKKQTNSKGQAYPTVAREWISNSRVMNRSTTHVLPTPIACVMRWVVSGHDGVTFPSGFAPTHSPLPSSVCTDVPREGTL